MKRLASWLTAAALLTAAPAWADGPDDLYLEIYGNLQAADALNQAGHYRDAALKYEEVATALKKFRANYPKWNLRIVDYRLGYTQERLDSLAKFVTPAETAPVTVELSSRRVTEKTGQDEQVKQLAEEIRRLESERSGLEAKLREALSIQPGTGDVARLGQAEEKITSLEKERDLLKAALDLAKASAPAEAAAGATRRISELEKERDELQTKITSMNKERAAQDSRAQSDLKLAEKRIKQLEEIEAKRDEVDKEMRTALDAALSGKISKGDQKRLRDLEIEKAELSDKFNQIAGQVASLQSEREQRIREKNAAEERIRTLERERDDLLRRVRTADATRPEDRERLAKENEQLRARIQAYEARPNPYSPEERALFSKPTEASTPKSFVVTQKMTKELPDKTKKVLSEADRAFAEQRYTDAQEKYGQALKQNDKNVYTLANLASTQLQLGQAEEAEKNLGKALAIDPDDAFSLLLLGKIKMSQGNWDDAVLALSRSSQINPTSAETQNYLGIVLSEKGQRVSAEAALRKAIQIQPDYASAHHNLAIIYATQKPPFTELARWHYEKAVALGHAKNPELEKMLGEGVPLPTNNP